MIVFEPFPDATVLDDPADYRGEPNVVVPCVTFRPRRVADRALAQRWADFFAVRQPIERLWVAESWITQEQLELLGRQTGLVELRIDAAKVDDLAPISKLQRLESLFIDRARVDGIEPLASLTRLRALWLLDTGSTLDLRPLAALTNLRTLTLEGGSPGNSSRVLTCSDLDWALPLQDLEELRLVSVRVLSRDLSPLAQLPRLATLTTPIRCHLRDQVAALAQEHPAFRELAKHYDEYYSYLER